MSKEIEDILSVIDKSNPYASFLNESAISNVDGWLDTGSMVLNGIVSGSLFGGIPKNRMTYIVTTYLISDLIILVCNQLMVNYGINHEKNYKVYLPSKLQEYYVNIIRLIVGGFVWIILSYPLRRYWVFA